MAVKRHVTPEDAREIWTALEKAGSTPSVRAVADQLNARGKHVSRSTVGRWKKANWSELPKRTPAPATVERECNAAERRKRVPSCLSHGLGHVGHPGTSARAGGLHLQVFTS
jgi:hypothetical protein